MGVTIEYHTKSDVAPDQGREIIAAVNAPNDQPWILCEPIQFYEMPGFENQLFGASKLNLIPDPAEKAAADANFNPEKNDLEFLIDQLTEISRRNGVDWTILIEGSPIGSIEKGECDPAVRETVSALAEVTNSLDELGDLSDFL